MIPRRKVIQKWPEDVAADSTVCTVRLLAAEFHLAVQGNVLTCLSASLCMTLLSMYTPMLCPMFPFLKSSLMLSRRSGNLGVDPSPLRTRRSDFSGLPAISSSSNSQRFFVKTHAHTDTPTQLPHDPLKSLQSLYPSLAIWLRFQKLSSDDLVIPRFNSLSKNINVLNNSIP